MVGAARRPPAGTDPRRCATNGTSARSTRWSTPAPPSSTPRRPTSTARTRPRTKRSPADGAAAVVIGSGPIRIGQGIEFDYASVHAAWALQDAGLRSVMVELEPGDRLDRLRHERPALLRTARRRGGPRHHRERDRRATEPPASIVQFGGQTAINLAGPLRRAGLPIIGSSAETIDTAEDRRLFERFLQDLGIPQPPGAAILTLEEAMKTAQTIGYPVLVRPSYVLGGRAMEIVQNADGARDVRRAAAAEAAQGKPILIDKFLEGARSRSRRDLRRRDRAHPRDHGAHRAGGRPLRRLDGGLPARAPRRRRARDNRRLHPADRARPGRHRPDEHPVRRAAARAGRRRRASSSSK